MMRRISGLMVVLLVSICALAPAQSTAPATKAVDISEKVVNGKLSVTFTVWQNNVRMPADKDGVVHLKPAPFEIRFDGDVDGTALLVSHSAKVIDAVAHAKQPVLTLLGMGSASDDNTLLIEDGPDREPALKSWAKFSEDFGKDEAAAILPDLMKQLKQEPLVLDAGLQYLHPEDGAVKATLNVKTLFESDFATDKGIHVAVIRTDEADGKYFRTVQCRTFKIVFGN